MNSKFDMPFIPQSLSDLLTEISMIRDFSLKISKLDFHIRFMEGELIKVEAFKHELLHSMQLLKDGIALLKKERSRLKEIEERRLREIEERRAFVTEERAESSQNNHRDMKACMSKARLWNASIQFHDDGNEALSFKFRGNNVGKRAYRDMEHVKGKGIYVEEISMPVHVEPIDMSDQEFQHQKKRRRCWSPDLHKRFVDALLELGGPIEATPRQIRDIMNVEGLTNDEVKSHLQKYRLHIRKISASTSASTEEKLEEGSSAAHDGSAATDEADKSVRQDCKNIAGVSTKT